MGKTIATVATPSSTADLGEPCVGCREGDAVTKDALSAGAASSSLAPSNMMATAAAAAAAAAAAEAEAEAMGVSDLLEAKWRDRLRDLLRYKEQYGDCNVPFQFKDDQRLAHWVLKQRKHYRHNELPEHRIRLLNDAGFMWTSYRRVTWEQRFEQLKLYRQRHGTALVPSSSSEDRTVSASSSATSSAPPWDSDTAALAQWVKKQRTTQRRKEMGPDRVARLDSIGFVWDVEDATWEIRYAELANFVRVYGPYSHPKDAGLKGWAYRQRHKYHENALSSEKRDKLDAIGFHWGQPGASHGKGTSNADAKARILDNGESDESHAATEGPDNPNPLSSLVNACLIVSTTNSSSSTSSSSDTAPPGTPSLADFSQPQSPPLRLSPSATPAARITTAEGTDAHERAVPTLSSPSSYRDE